MFKFVYNKKCRTLDKLLFVFYIITGIFVAGLVLNRIAIHSTPDFPVIISDKVVTYILCIVATISGIVVLYKGKVVSLEVTLNFPMQEFDNNASTRRIIEYSKCAFNKLKFKTLHNHRSYLVSLGCLELLLAFMLYMSLIP